MVLCGGLEDFSRRLGAPPPTFGGLQNSIQRKICAVFVDVCHFDTEIFLFFIRSRTKTFRDRSSFLSMPIKCSAIVHCYKL